MKDKESAHIADVFQEVANIVDEWRTQPAAYSDIEIAYGLIEVLVAMDGRDNWNEYLVEALNEVIDKEHLICNQVRLTKPDSLLPYGVGAFCPQET